MRRRRRSLWTDSCLSLSLRRVRLNLSVLVVRDEEEVDPVDGVVLVVAVVVVEGSVDEVVVVASLVVVVEVALVVDEVVDVEEAVVSLVVVVVASAEDGVVVALAGDGKHGKLETRNSCRARGLKLMGLKL